MKKSQKRRTVKKEKKISQERYMVYPVNQEGGESLMHELGDTGHPSERDSW